MHRIDKKYTHSTMMAFTPPPSLYSMSHYQSWKFNDSVRRRALFKLMYSAVRTAIMVQLAGYVCVCVSTVYCSWCGCASVHSIYLLCACLCFYVTLHNPTNLSFFFFLSLCSTAVLLYCFCRAIYYLPFPRLGAAGWCSKQEDHSSYEVLRFSPCKSHVPTLL